MTAAHYRLTSPAGGISADRGVSADGGGVSADGSADVRVTDGTLVLTPSAGDVLRVPFGQIAAISENEPFTIQVALTGGTTIELSRLGRMRTQLLAELHDGRADDGAAALRAVGEAVVFTGVSGEEPVDLRVYDDALLILSAAGDERISFAFVSAIQSADYLVTIEVASRSPVTVSRLGRRTSEFAGLLADRLAAARGRTTAFLGALLPWLDPIALGRVAGLLRDGVAVPSSILDGVHPGLADALVGIAVLPARREAVAELSRHAELAVGFKQVASVHHAAVGATPWRDPAVAPHLDARDSPGGSFPAGPDGLLMAGIAQAGIMPDGLLMAGIMPGGIMPGEAAPGASPFGFGGGYGLSGGYWAFRALGALGPGASAGQQRPMTRRPDLPQERLVPATDELAALTVTSENPAVLAFVLCRSADRVVLEILNQAEPATFVYRAAGPDGLAAINRALDDSGFPPAAGHAAGQDSAPQPGPSRLLTGSLAGQVAHDAHWSSQLTALLSG